MAYLGGIHFWWPKITGRLYPETSARIAGGDHLPRLQPDLLPAVHARLPGHAAALPRLPAGVPGAQRHVHRRARRSSASATCCRCSTSSGRCATAVVAGANPGARRAWSGRRPRRRRPRTSTYTPIVTEDPYGYSVEERARRCRLSEHRRRCPASRISSTTPSSSTKPPRWGCGCSWSRRSCSSAACSRPTSSTARHYPGSSRTPAITST